MKKKNIQNLKSSKGQKEKSVPKRGRHTFSFPCNDPKIYMDIINDRKLFNHEVVSHLGDWIDAAVHKPECIDHKKYKLRGFRKNPRRALMPDGTHQDFPIRLVQCINCGQKFSVLPSFLPKEKHCYPEKSYTFQCPDSKTYLDIVEDREIFRHEIINHLEEWVDATGHSPVCTNHKKYKMRGFRWKPHREVMPDGNYREFPIRMVQCLDCGHKFALFPSFLTRTSYFSI